MARKPNPVAAGADLDAAIAAAQARRDAALAEIRDLTARRDAAIAARRDAALAARPGPGGAPAVAKASPLL